MNRSEEIYRISSTRGTWLRIGSKRKAWGLWHSYSRYGTGDPGLVIERAIVEPGDWVDVTSEFAAKTRNRDE